MHFSNIVAASTLAMGAMAADHKVAVGTKSGQIVFMPESLQAAQGDTVTFRFWPKNHSVAQAAFARPCQPLANGFWSGFMPTSDQNAVANTTYTIEVKNASAPIWFYCTQGQHCQGGMVGVINPPQSGPNTIAAFKNSSSLAQQNVSPTSVRGTGGNFTSADNATSTDPNGPQQSTNAASPLTASIAYAGVAGLFSFFML